MVRFDLESLARLVMADVDLKTVADLLGDSIVETARYAHLAPDFKAREIERLVDDESICKVDVVTPWSEATVGTNVSASQVRQPNLALDLAQRLPLWSQVDRKVLYDQVWRDPVRVVANLYGRSDVAVAKVCSKLNVPLPGRGYWAKVAAKLPVPPKPPLPPLRRDGDQTVSD